MAGEWLKFDKATPEKPEVFAMATELGIDPDAVVGKLMRIWSWFDTHTTDGNAMRVTPPLLDRIAGITGFVAAMANCGWISIETAGCVLPNFSRHCGETAKGRALGAKRSAGFRARNGDSVTSALPREEKRREEINTLSVNTDSEDAKAPAQEKPQRVIPVPAILAAYHDRLPMLTAVRKMTDNRKRKLKARWTEDAERQSVEYWDKFFGYVAQSDFLTGRDNRWTACDFEWLIESSNHVKVIEGKYENREGA